MTPPKHIKNEAKKEWDRITAELASLNKLTPAIRPLLIMYVETWARLREAYAHVESEGCIVPSPKTGVPMHSLWLQVYNKAHEQLIKMLSEMGMTPKHIKAKPVEDDDFADLADLKPITMKVA